MEEQLEHILNIFSCNLTCYLAINMVVKILPLMFSDRKLVLSSEENILKCLSCSCSFSDNCSVNTYKEVRKKRCFKVRFKYLL